MRRSLIAAGTALLLTPVGWYLWDAQQREHYAQVAAATKAADALGVGSFHDTLPGEEEIAKATSRFDFPEEADAQRLKRSCGALLTCNKKYDTPTIVLRVLDAAEQELQQFVDARVSVAGITVPAGTRFKDWGLDGGDDESTVVAHTLRLKAERADPADPGFKAWMVRGNKEKELEVAYRRDADAPLSAQFLWIPEGTPFGSGRQSIGVRCSREGWCFLGESKAIAEWEGSTQRCTDDAMNSNCVTRFGFHDEQRLAATVGGDTEHSSSRGLIIPHPALGTYTDGTFANAIGTYQPSARIRLWGDGYKGLPSKTEILVDIRQEANNVWRARFTWDGGQIERLVNRTSHTGYQVLPGTRWKWHPRDEGIWVRCGAGCCEVDLL
jgi:hypothetical protein